MTRKQLFDAIERGSLKEVRKFLQGVDINHKDEKGRTPLLKAIDACTQQTDVVKYLLENDARPDISDWEGRSAFHYAVMSGVRGVVQVLMTRTLDLNLQDKNGQTALHYAVDRNWTQLVDWMVFLGADVNKKDKKGNSAKSLSTDDKVSDALEQKVDPERIAERILAESFEQKSVRNMKIKFGSEQDFTVSTTFLLLKRYDPYDYPQCPKLKGDEVFWGEIIECRISQPNIQLTLTFPLQDNPGHYSEVFVKYATLNKDEQESVAEVACLPDEKCWVAIAKIRLGARGWFVVCNRPGNEELDVPEDGGRIISTLDKDVEIDIPKKAFGKPGKLSLQVEESPPVTRDLHAILALSRFYEIEHTSGAQPQKEVTMSLPLPQDYTGEGELVVLSRSGPASVTAEDKDDQAWSILDTNIVVKEKIITFKTKHFSTKVVLESPKGTTAKERRSSVSKSHKRRKIQIVTFFACGKLFTPKTHDVIVECCKSKNLQSRLDQWRKEAYFCLRTSGMHRSKAGHEYGLKIQGNLQCLQDISNLKLIYYPGMNCYQSLEMKVPNKVEIYSGNIGIKDRKTSDILTYLSFVLDEKAYSVHGEEVSKTAVTEVQKGVDEAYAPREIGFKGKFIAAEVTDQLSDVVFDSWWKMWLYLGFSRQSLLMVVDPVVKCRQMFEKWFSSNSMKPDLGLSKLLCVLKTVEKLHAAQTVVDYLKMCSNAPDCRQEWEEKPFWKWLNEQTFSLEELTKEIDVPEPMSDLFLLDILEHFTTDVQLLWIALGLTKNEIDTIKKDTSHAGLEYGNFLILVKARDKFKDPTEFLQTLLKELETQELNMTKDIIIDLTEQWIKTADESKGDTIASYQQVLANWKNSE